jgi:hypothetical protein
MSNSIELYTKLNDPLAAVTALGKVFAKSGFAGCDREEQGQFLALVCLSENKTPTELLRTFDIVEGKLRKKALAALAEFNSIGGKHRWISTGQGTLNDDLAAELELELAGNKITSRFSIGDAKRGGAKLKTANGHDTVWAKTPSNMLRARCISNGVAMLAPSIFAGDIDEPHEPAALNLSPIASAVIVDVQSDEAAEAAAGLAPISAATSPSVSLPIVSPVAHGSGESDKVAADSPSKSTPPDPLDTAANPAAEGASGVASLSDELETKLCDKFEFELLVNGTAVDSSAVCRDFLAAQKGEFNFPLNKSLREMKTSVAEKIIASPRFVPAVRKFYAEKK